MKEHEPTYSDIIEPAAYNKIITDEHLYIAASDLVIRSFLEEEVQRGAKEVVEIGCGPARILQMMGQIPEIRLTGVDHDPKFLAYATQAISGTRIRLIQAEIAKYFHDEPVDVFYSQGTHHHILKGEATSAYLQNISNELKLGGAYIVGDEFLPDYKDEHERHVKAVIWYSHIISSAQRQGFAYLAQEEAKTLIDDLHEGTEIYGAKSEEQISLVLHSVDAMNDAALSGDLSTANTLAETFLRSFHSLSPSTSQNDPTMSLSRGDYKICESVFRNEVEAFGFMVEKSKVIGPINTIGGMVVYVLRKK